MFRSRLWRRSESAVDDPGSLGRLAINQDYALRLGGRAGSSARKGQKLTAATMSSIDVTAASTLS